jgi:hypothetical protein
LSRGSTPFDYLHQFADAWIRLVIPSLVIRRPGLVIFASQ